MLKVLELFGGIGAPRKALERLRIDYKIVDYVEIDKYAVKSYNAIYNESYELQDICNWNKDIEVDLIFHGSPCQDFSLAGKQAGGDEGTGTRSSLMYETIRIVKRLKPKYIIWENVKNVLSLKHRHNFNNYLHELENLGYMNYFKVLNAKDFGIPQNRERVFVVSILGDSAFEFPLKQELELKLKDILEDEVDKKYYLDDVKIKNYTRDFGSKGKLQENICDTLQAAMGCGGGNIPIVKRKYGVFDTEKSKHQAGSVYDEEGLSPTLDTMQGGWRQPCIEIKNATKQGYAEAYEGDSINLEQPTSKTRRGRVGEQKAQTLTTSCNQGVVQEDLRIRKLIPKECWRLMGFSDEDFEKAEKVNSNTQLYKQAGNSIVVNILERILENLLLEKKIAENQTTIFDFI